IACSSLCSPLSSALSSARSSLRSACSVSACEWTDTYSPAAIDMDPATRPATPATNTLRWFACAAATPSTRLEVERMPSFAPSTAARSQPIRCVRCCSALPAGMLEAFLIWLRLETSKDFESSVVGKQNRCLVRHRITVNRQLLGVFNFLFRLLPKCADRCAANQSQGDEAGVNRHERPLVFNRNFFLGPENSSDYTCRSPKIDRIVFRAARHTQPVNQVRRSAVHRIDPPALNGVGNQTNGRRHRTRGLAARSLQLETNPSIAQRKSPRTTPPRLRGRPPPCHIPGSGRSSAPESSHVA